MPILGSIRPTAKPGSSAWTRNAEMPSPVWANTVYTVATPALVMNRLVPSITQWSPSRRAAVAIA